MIEREEVDKAASKGIPGLAHDQLDGRGESYAAAGAATLALFGGLLGVLIGWIIGASPRSIPGQGTLAGSDLLSTTLVAGLFGVGIGALIGALWGLNIPRHAEKAGGMAHVEDADDHSERVVPLDYAAIRMAGTPAPVTDTRSLSQEVLMPLGHEGSGSPPEQSTSTTDDRPLTTDHVQPDDETGGPTMDDQHRGQDPDSVTGTQGAFDPVTGAYGTAGTPVTTGYGVSGSTIGTGSSQVRDEHEQGDFAGSTPDSASYEMGGRASDDMPTPSQPDDSSDTPVTEKNKGTATDQATAQSDPRTQDLYEAGPSYGPGVGQGTDTALSAGSSHDSNAEDSLDSPPSGKAINAQEIDASAGTNIAGTSDPRGLGDNTDEA